MGSSKTKKTIASLKERVQNAESNLFLLKNQMTDELYQRTMGCVIEIKTLIEAYEKQIWLNKKKNIKIKNQRDILKALQRKQGGAK